MNSSQQAPNPSASESSVLNAIAAVLYLLYIVFTAMERYARGVVDIPELIGAILGPVIITIVIIGIVRLFKRATTPRGTAKVAVCMLALFAVGSFGGLIEIVGASQRAPADAAARLAKGAIRAAGLIPKRIDAITMLNGVEAHSDTLVYYLQLRMTPEEWKDSQGSTFRTQLINRICGDRTLRDESIAKGVIVRYRYSDMYNRDLASIYVTEAVCNAPGGASA